MLHITTYKVTAKTPEEVEALMKRFGEVGTPETQVAHYVFADGSGGLVISAEEDARELHRSALAFSQWLELESKVALTVDDALPAIFEAMQR